MRDRTLAVILTIVAILLLGFPGLVFLCLGLIDFIVFYGFGVPFIGNTPVWVNVLGAIGVCLGFFLLVITIIAAYFMLRRPAETLPPKPPVPTPPVIHEHPAAPMEPGQPAPHAPPAPPETPAEPAEPETPAPPSNPDEPLPPSY
jgi:hypothetical protein